MELKEELESTRKRQQDIVKQINQLEEQKQQLLQEVLRLDGEIRLLARLSKDGDKGKEEATK